MGLINKEWMDEYHEGLVQNLSGKADKADTYTKDQVDAAIANVDVTEQLTDYAKKTEVSTAVAAETERAQEVESTLQGSISTETERAQGAETALDGRIDTLEENVAYLGENDGSAVVADFDPQTDTVWKKAQTLSAAEKEQIQHNIGVREWLNTLTGEKFASFTATAQTTSVTQVLPVTGETDTVYRVGKWDGAAFNEEYYSDYAWNESAYVQLNKKSIVGEVFDISEYHGGAKYADLTAALGTNGANIPDNLRKGGMSVKFVQSSDNKYVQYRYMGTATDATFTTVANWQGVDDKLCPNSTNLIENGPVFYSTQKIKSKINLSTFYANKAKLELDEDGKFMKADGSYDDYAPYSTYKLSEFTLNQILNLSVYMKGSVPIAIAFDSNNNVVTTVAHGDTSEAYKDIVINLEDYPTISYIIINTYEYSTHNPIDISSVDGMVQVENYPEKIDDRPINQSNNLVRSGGVAGAISPLKQNIDILNQETFYSCNANIILDKPNQFMTNNASYTSFQDYNTYKIYNFKSNQIIAFKVYMRGNSVSAALIFDSTGTLLGTVSPISGNEGKYYEVSIDLTDYPTADYIIVNTYQYSTHEPIDLTLVEAIVMTERYPELIDNNPIRSSTNLVRSGGVERYSFYNEAKSRINKRRTIGYWV